MIEINKNNILNFLALTNLSMEEYNNYIINEPFKIPKKISKAYPEATLSDVYNNLVWVIFLACDALSKNKIKLVLWECKTFDEFKQTAGIIRVDNFRRAVFEEIKIRLSTEEFPEFFNKRRYTFTNIQTVEEGRDFSLLEFYLNPISKSLILNSNWNEISEDFEPIVNHFGVIFDKVEDNEKNIKLYWKFINDLYADLAKKQTMYKADRAYEAVSLHEFEINKLANWYTRQWKAIWEPNLNTFSIDFETLKSKTNSNTTTQEAQTVIINKLLKKDEEITKNVVSNITSIINLTNNLNEASENLRAKITDLTTQSNTINTTLNSLKTEHETTKAEAGKNSRALINLTTALREGDTIRKVNDLQNQWFIQSAEVNKWVEWYTRQWKAIWEPNLNTFSTDFETLKNEVKILKNISPTSSGSTDNSTGSFNPGTFARLRNKVEELEISRGMMGKYITFLNIWLEERGVNAVTFNSRHTFETTYNASNLPREEVIEESEDSSEFLIKFKIKYTDKRRGVNKVYANTFSKHINKHNGWGIESVTLWPFLSEENVEYHQFDHRKIFIEFKYREKDDSRWGDKEGGDVIFKFLGVNVANNSDYVGFDREVNINDFNVEVSGIIEGFVSEMNWEQNTKKNKRIN